MLLQDECGYTGALPYWHEQRDFEVYGSIEEASVWGSDEYSFGTSGVNTTNGTNCVIDGPFANTTLHIDQFYGVDYYYDYCLAREFNQTAWESVNQTYVDECYLLDDYNDANFCYVQNPHAGGHLATGGTVSLSSFMPPPPAAYNRHDCAQVLTTHTNNQMEDQNASPGDPVFFVHHANLDRLWWEWQQANLSSRLTDMSGQEIPPLSIMLENKWVYPSRAYLDYDGDPGNDTTLNHVLWMQEIIPNKTIAEVMDSSNSLICAEYVEASLTE